MSIESEWKKVEKTNSLTIDPVPSPSPITKTASMVKALQSEVKIVAVWIFSYLLHLEGKAKEIKRFYFSITKKMKDIVIKQNVR